MLRKAGLRSFCGQAFLPDICELDTEMLPMPRCIIPFGVDAEVDADKQSITFA